MAPIRQAPFASLGRPIPKQIVLQLVGSFGLLEWARQGPYGRRGEARGAFHRLCVKTLEGKKLQDHFHSGPLNLLTARTRGDF